MSEATMAIPDPTQRTPQRVPVGLLLVIAGLLFGIGIYVLTRGDAPVAKAQLIQQITLVQPPPPPPPPPEEKIPEPEKIIEPVEEAVVQEDVQDVSEQPSPEPTSAPAGVNRAADVGSDSFHLAAGKGGGLFGTGGGGGSWSSFVSTHVRRALREDPRTSTASGYIEVLLSIDLNGRFERAELQSSTGNKELDEAIRDVLSRLPPLSRGRPASIKSPLTVTGINMRGNGGNG